MLESRGSYRNSLRQSGAMIRAREALNALCLFLSASAIGRLTSAESSELERICSIIGEGIPNAPISSYALREFAGKVRKSGLIENGQADNIADLLKDAESLKLLVA